MLQDQARHTIFDPCLVGEDGETIVCGASPAREEPGIKLKLTESLPAGDRAPGATPWPHGFVIELEDGTLCTMKAGGTSLVFDDERVNYWCSEIDKEGSSSGILGDLEVGSVWTAQRIVIEYDGMEWLVVESSVVPVRTVWQ
jgi:hypothetical protein